MYWETMSMRFWTGFYLFLLITMVVAIYNFISKKLKKLSLVSILLAISIPFVEIINSISKS